MVKKRKRVLLRTYILIAVLVVLVLVLATAIILNTLSSVDAVEECDIDAECVPATCCHADACVPVGEKPDCSDTFCSAVCSSSLDCEAGRCGCVSQKCVVVLNE